MFANWLAGCAKACSQLASHFIFSQRKFSWKTLRKPRSQHFKNWRSQGVLSKLLWFSAIRKRQNKPFNQRFVWPCKFAQNVSFKLFPDKRMNYLPNDLTYQKSRDNCLRKNTFRKKGSVTVERFYCRQELLPPEGQQLTLTVSLQQYYFIAVQN